jgi:murein DD-endopeptidase MepM/ murein hydrolase activator NlpD
MAYNNLSSLPPSGARASWEAGQQQTAREAARLREASQMFEAQFVKMMLGEMRRTVSQNGLINGGFGEEMFTDVLDQERAEVIVKGRGIGLSQMLEEQLSHKFSPRPVQFRMPAPAAEKEPEEAQASSSAPAVSPALSAAVPLEDSARPRQSANPVWNKLKELMAQAEEAAGEAAAEEAGASGAAYIWPVSGDISSAFGLRTHPVLKTMRQHNGIDLKAAYGTPIQAAAGGTVIFAGQRGQLGQTVIVQHQDGSRSVYGHCSGLLAREGQEVFQGQVIAKVGSSGLATGPHLHFEIRNPEGQALDPGLSLAPQNKELA